MRSLDQLAARRPWGRRAAVLASLLVAGQLASATHLLLVRHAICPLDGELIHPDAAGEHRDARIQAANGRFPGMRAAEAAEAHHGREHCILASHRRDRAVFPAQAVEFRAPPRAILATLSPDGNPAVALVVLHRLAPKQSPPA